MIDYWHYLVAISLGFLLLEKLVPWHRPNPTLRRGWLRDLAFLAINGHFFVFWLTILAGTQLVALFDYSAELLAATGLDPRAEVAADWPAWLQFLAFFALADFVQWCTHLTLHYVPPLWAFHKVHHSIDRLDWAANFHFHWFEILVYRTTQALPLAWLGAPYEVTFWVFVVGTAWGHFNHANLPFHIGPLRFLLNSPRMHIWHHDASDEGGVAKNFGIVLSLWDWVFRTAYWPADREPERLGYPGDEDMPQHLGGQLLWPASRLLPRPNPPRE